MILPLLIRLLPALHLSILHLHSCTGAQIVFGVLGNSVTSPGHVRLEHWRLVWTSHTSVLGDELVLRGGIIDVGESFLVWAEVVGGFGCAAGEEVSADKREIGKKFTNFGVGEDERKDGAKMLYGYIYNERLST